MQLPGIANTREGTTLFKGSWHCSSLPRKGQSEPNNLQVDQLHSKYTGRKDFCGILFKGSSCHGNLPLKYHYERVLPSSRLVAWQTHVKERLFVAFYSRVVPSAAAYHTKGSLNINLQVDQLHGKRTTRNDFNLWHFIQR